jgi:ribonuclease BN (tRNA processing enzyme)
MTASASCTPPTPARSGVAQVFGAGADLVLSEATYQHDDIRAPIHLSARQAGESARDAGARHLMLTHLWPTIDPIASVEEGSEGFGKAAVLAAPHLVTHI